MKKILSAFIVTGMMVSGAAVATPGANSSTINFTGKIVEVPCVLSTDSQDQNIDLGNAATSQLADPGSSSTPVPVKITLENCNVDTYKNASFTFTGLSTDSNSKALDNTNTSGASHVGVEIKDKNDTNVVFDGTTAAGDTDISAVEAGGSFTTDFTADMISLDGGATAGDVSAQTTFTVAYN